METDCIKLVGKSLAPTQRCGIFNVASNKTVDKLPQLFNYKSIKDLPSRTFLFGFQLKPIV